MVSRSEKKENQMKLTNLIQTAIALLTATAYSAAADQFAIQTEAPVAGASQGLLASLQIREIDAVEINGVYFLVIDAKDEAYVEAYVNAQHIDAKGLYRLEADWSGVGLSSLPIEAREPFLEETECAYCKS
jgi:uncharacterized protein involved in high-affinity Fe2+ transport